MRERGGDRLLGVPSKKKLSHLVLSGAAKIHALVDAAAASIERDGIACTSQLERTLFDDMNGLCRELMAALLSSEEATRVDYEPTGSERNGGCHEKRIVTLFGELPPIRRTYYYDTEKKDGHYPFDDRLGLFGRYTPALCAEAMRYAVNHPYGDASREFARAHSFALSPDAMMEIVDAHGAKAAEFAKDKDVGEKEDKDAPADIVYGLVDGTGIALRKKHTSKTKGKKGRKGKSKTREVKMAVFFRGGIDSENEPFRLSESTTYVATMDRRAKFEKQARAEFDRRFGRKPKLMIYISDGGKWTQTVRKNEFPFAVEILDIFHAIEHLKPLMLGLGIKEGSKRWKRLHRRLRDKISEGKIESVLNSVWKGKYGKLTKDAMKEFKYFRRNKDRMKYDEYRANGWFYGSGMVESGCKTVVGQRFKQSGMIWSLDGSKALLALRTLYKSNRLDEFFNHLVAGLPQVACAA